MIFYAESRILILAILECWPNQKLTDFQLNWIFEAGCFDKAPRGVTE